LAREEFWNELAAQLSVDAIRASTAAGSGHPTSSMSASHLAAVLFSDHLRFDVDNPENLANDRFVLSKGHASPLLYALFKAMGAITDEELLSFRKKGSRLQGHPTPVLPWVDVATGSLGQGLPIGFGMAMGMRMDEIPARVWVLLGDSESAEGSVWEAMANASYHGTKNLVAILDMNRFGQRGPTMLEWNGEAYVRRAESFGWRAVEIDGHDVHAIDEAYKVAEDGNGPTFIVARTKKGNGVSFLEDKGGLHGQALKPDQARQAIEELGGERNITFRPKKPEVVKVKEPGPPTSVNLPRYEDGVATRKAFGEALAALAVRPEVVALDGEVGNSTYTEDFQKVAPDRFVEVFIQEQNMLGTAVGLQVVGKAPFAATFGAFHTRAYDFIRMAAVSQANIRLCGSHAGVSIGEDGPSQMALEDLAMMRAVHGSTVLYPSDGNSTAHLVETMANTDGISYIRTTRERTPKLYGPDDIFPIGGSKTLQSSDDDWATLVGAGVTVFEAIEAAEILARDGIAVRVIDAYSVKPIDATTLQKALEETGLLVVVEDHWIEGGLGDAALAAVTQGGREMRGQVLKLAVTQMPGSASPEEQRQIAGIDAASIADAVRDALKATSNDRRRQRTGAGT
jgi:transketolase